MSSNITLSSYSPKDREWLGELLVEQDVRRFLPHLTTNVDIFINDMKIAETKGLGKFWIVRLDYIGIGFISIYDLKESPFIFYAMSPIYRHKGYMHNAIKMIDKKYPLTLSTVVAENNIQSVKLISNTTIKVEKL